MALLRMSFYLFIRMEKTGYTDYTEELDELIMDRIIGYLDKGAYWCLVIAIKSGK